MLAETQKKEPGYAITLNGYAMVIFTKLFRSLQKNNPDENYPKAFFLDMMQTLIDYIDTNYNEPITLSTLATKCYFNPSYISREFKKLSGKGFKEYITEKRISEAEKYLTQTDLSIEEIQVKIGFTNKTRFFKEFSKYYNCTPGEYRKKHQE
jgi:YesN/AraC family two-component response regulator